MSLLNKITYVIFFSYKAVYWMTILKMVTVPQNIWTKKGDSRISVFSWVQKNIFALCANSSNIALKIIYTCI